MKRAERGAESWRHRRAGNTSAHPRFAARGKSHPHVLMQRSRGSVDAIARCPRPWTKVSTASSRGERSKKMDGIATRPHCRERRELRGENCGWAAIEQAKTEQESRRQEN